MAGEIKLRTALSGLPLRICKSTRLVVTLVLHAIHVSSFPIEVWRLNSTLQDFRVSTSFKRTTSRFRTSASSFSISGAHHLYSSAEGRRRSLESFEDHEVYMTMYQYGYIRSAQPRRYTDNDCRNNADRLTPIECLRGVRHATCHNIGLTLSTIHNPSEIPWAPYKNLLTTLVSALCALHS